MIVHIVGTRPNFVKLAPLFKELDTRGIQQKIIHTGQHYDKLMSEVFFRDFNLPEPHYNLSVGSGTHTDQISIGIKQCADALIDIRPNLAIVYGDVNSTLYATLAAVKTDIPVAHIESGCRNFDKTMPEEINRVVVDHVSKYLFCIDEDGKDNLQKEGINENVFFCGNLMTDSLWKLPDKWEDKSNEYSLLTLHRASNTNDTYKIDTILKAVNELGKKFLFPVHPRIMVYCQQTENMYKNITFMKPLPYAPFIHMLKRAKCIITDSGGIQVEASALNIRCITIRKSTEHLSTIKYGTNSLCPNLDDLPEHFNTSKRIEKIPWFWDGNSAVRTADVIEALL